MQQLSGSFGRGGTHTPATNTLFFCISDLRSSGELNREEKRMLGPGSSSAGFVEMGGAVEGVAVVVGLLVIVGVEESRIEA